MPSTRCSLLVSLCLLTFMAYVNSHNITDNFQEGSNATTNADHVGSMHKRNAVATDPSNIRFVLGNTQLFPLPQSKDAKEISPVTSKSVHPNVSQHVDNNSELSSDVGNNGGNHESNINIGGIQNFGGDINAGIAKLIADKGNTGGSHQSNVAIGGILNFK